MCTHPVEDGAVDTLLESSSLPTSSSSELNHFAPQFQNQLALVVNTDGFMDLYVLDLKSSLEGGGPRSGGGCWSLYARKVDALK